MEKRIGWILGAIVISVQCILLYNYFAKYIKEKFKDKDVMYASDDHMLNIVNISPFFKKMTEYDLIARNTYSISSYKEQYYDSLEKFSKEEKAVLETLTTEIDTIPTANLKKIPWKFAKVSQHIENGYPHTRANDIICIPSNMRFPSLEETLSHEVVHIHQRNNPAIWERFLNREKWFLESPETIPSRWREKCRINPDTFQKQFWSFKKRFIPLPLFIKDSNVRFDEIKVMYYDLQTGVLEHNTPKEIIDAYGKDIPQPEHPYEIYAVILGKLYPLSTEKIERFMSE